MPGLSIASSAGAVLCLLIPVAAQAQSQASGFPQGLNGTAKIAEARRNQR